MGSPISMYICTVDNRELCKQKEEFGPSVCLGGLFVPLCRARLSSYSAAARKSVNYSGFSLTQAKTLAMPSQDDYVCSEKEGGGE
jgi:hypothetical protein